MIANNKIGSSAIMRFGEEPNWQCAIRLKKSLLSESDSRKKLGLVRTLIKHEYAWVREIGLWLASSLEGPVSEELIQLLLSAAIGAHAKRNAFGKKDPQWLHADSRYSAMIAIGKVGRFSRQPEKIVSSLCDLFLGMSDRSLKVFDIWAIADIAEACNDNVVKSLWKLLVSTDDEILQQTIIYALYEVLRKSPAILVQVLNEIYYVPNMKSESRCAIIAALAWSAKSKPQASKIVKNLVELYESSDALTRNTIISVMTSLSMKWNIEITDNLLQYYDRGHVTTRRAVMWALFHISVNSRRDLSRTVQKLAATKDSTIELARSWICAKGILEGS
jgi:hypothetical protein